MGTDFLSTIQLQNTAVVVVHGIGEQRPLDTLLGFVGDGTDKVGILERNDPPAFVNPDPVQETSYLRRVTINAASMTRDAELSNVEGTRRRLARTVDFYEYYWAYQFRDTTWREVKSWVAGLLRTRRDEISPYANECPSPLRGTEDPVTRRCLWTAVGVLWLALLADGVSLSVPVVHARIETAFPYPAWYLAPILLIAAVAMVVLLIAAMGPLGLISVAWIIVMLVVLCALVTVVATMNWSVFQASCHWVGALASLGVGSFVCLLLWLLNRAAAKAVPVAQRIPNVRNYPLILRYFVASNLVGLALLAISVGGLVLSVWDAFKPAHAVLVAVIPSIFAAATLVAGRAVLSGVGDAARYLSNSPDDIQQREEIRTGLVKILERLHSQQDSATGLPTYDRVVIVGHSLGSVIAYDAIRVYWTTVARNIALPAKEAPEDPDQQEFVPSGFGEPVDGQNAPEAGGAEAPQDGPDLAGSSLQGVLQQRAWAARLAALRRIERLVVQDSEDAVPEKNYTRALPEVASTERWISAQRNFQALLKHPSTDPYTPSDTLARWIITDLITIGSPLAHAELLLAKGNSDLTRLKQRRLFPADPPAYSSIKLSTPVAEQAPREEISSMLRSFVSSLQPPVGDTTRMLSAAPFSAVVWTNMHFEHDLVGGQVTQVLGNGIRDITLPEVRPYLLNFLLKYPHSSYWHGKRDRPMTTASCKRLHDLLLAPLPVLRVAGTPEPVARFADWLYSRDLIDPASGAIELERGEPVAELRILVLSPAGIRQSNASDDTLCPVQWMWPGISPMIDLSTAERIAAVVAADPELQLCLSSPDDDGDVSGSA